MRLVTNLFLSTLFLTSMSFADNVKIGVVDLEHAVLETEDGAQAKARMKKESDAKQKVLNERKTELEKLEKALQGQGAMMKPGVQEEKQRELQRKYAEAQQLLMAGQQELAKLEQELMSGILGKMGTIVQTKGSAGDYTVILDKSRGGVLYSKPHLDLTNEIIREYNDAYGKKGMKSKKTK